ncbi:hypothetical protein BKA67DRAFT_661104 [Truncatella angustata]|uniref:Uncharacterized protein n=1 Tax=Truncatella angustata TaxID=152316 RepID=A0A9P8UHN0_9PEZI|nr:uncharacterized protein BKA67DRAFT_661104 [Truncatella angustata]KAH6652361.1 hypothetical protein BKA67DRAFT_661104 [Truncatella angustata]
MQFTTAFLTTALSFAASTYAWAQAGDGTWVANNNWYTLWYNRGDTRVHEACTWMNTDNVHNAGDSCAYWSNSNGGIFHGKCDYFKRTDGGKLWPTMDCR